MQSERSEVSLSSSRLVDSYKTLLKKAVIAEVHTHC
jgi:hypothetical protein